MTDREKLIELLREGIRADNEKKEAWILGGKVGEKPSVFENMADHLIANGVTIKRERFLIKENGEIVPLSSKWIPVTERLPKSIANKVITLSENGYVGFGHYENYKGRQTWYNLESDEPFTAWNHDDDSYEVTHWMPLPKPPKGE